VLIHRKTWDEIGKLSKEPARYNVRYCINRANEPDELEDSDEHSELSEEDSNEPGGPNEMIVDEPEPKEVAVVEPKPKEVAVDEHESYEMVVDTPESNEMAGAVPESSIQDEENSDNEIIAGTASGFGFRPRKASHIELFSSDEEVSDAGNNSYENIENVTYESDDGEASGGYATRSKTSPQDQAKRTVKFGSPASYYKGKRYVSQLLIV
jgi:hypothetical protein